MSRSDAPTPPTDQRPSALSPWLIWLDGALAGVFGAWILLPTLFLVPGLFRPPVADMHMRRDVFWLLYIGITDRRALMDDPLRTLTAAAGMVAGLLCVIVTVLVIVALVRTGRSAWPGRARKARPADLVAMAGLAVALVAVTGASLAAPVPARPFDWWFLVAAIALASQWTGGRLAWMEPIAALLAGAVTLGIATDLSWSAGQALYAPAGIAEVVALVAVLVATVGSVAVAWRDREEARAAGTRTPIPLAAIVASAILGVLLVWASATAWYEPPSRVFGDVRGRRVVLLSPHLDDESAFAGETLSWLSRHGADVTVVFTTDSAGGRALDKRPEYLRGRHEVWAGVSRELGITRTYTVDTVRDGNRMPGPEKVELIRDWVQTHGLVDRDTLLFAISGTGQSDHRATFAAARLIAMDEGIPLFVYWGYDDSHDTIMRAEYGAPIRADGGPSPLASKAAAVDSYLAFYEDLWPRTLPRVLLASRGAHDTLSVLTDGVMDRGSRLRGLPQPRRGLVIAPRQRLGAAPRIGLVGPGRAGATVKP